MNSARKNNKEEEKEEKIYNCSKIIIQKYIESPLLYKGRKCDMRIWVLLTHQMKVFLFKEGHLKTCSVQYDLNSKNAFTHITNYSFQKYSTNFQKFEKGNEVPFYEFQKFIDKEYPNKKYSIKKDLMKQIKDIINITMRSGKDKINKNGRSHQFEIFGYDFMLDSDFNLFLIEINSNPGLEISSPWIQIVVPRMLDDALRLTVDKIFEPVYDFSKNYKGDYTEEQKKLLISSKIEFDFNSLTPRLTSKEQSTSSFSVNKTNSPPPTYSNISKFSNNINNNNNSNSNSNNTNNEVKSNKIDLLSKYNNAIFTINLDVDKESKNFNNSTERGLNMNKENNQENKKENISKNCNNNNDTKSIKTNKDIKVKKNSNKDIKEIKSYKNRKDSDKNILKKKEKNYNKKYISPFPVPGYSLSENLWEFVCDLNLKDPYEIKTEKKIDKEISEKDVFTGIRHLLKKKNKINKDNKGNIIKDKDKLTKAKIMKEPNK
jgi:hypothetical protein